MFNFVQCIFIVYFLRIETSRNTSVDVSFYLSEMKVVIFNFLALIVVYGTLFIVV